jgi:hypothetical protein
LKSIPAKSSASSRPAKPSRGKKYPQRSIRERIEAFFLDHVGQIVTREQIQAVAADPVTGKVPENWHQRLSELRTDAGYTIQSWRDSADLKMSQYRLVSAEKRTTAGQRVRIHPATWQAVLERAGHACEWEDSGQRCSLQEGTIDPVSGGTVRLTADHKTPHASQPVADANDPSAWQALCGRHQVVKKNFWDHGTGKLNVYAIVHSAPRAVKREIYEYLRAFFGDAP